MSRRDQIKMSEDEALAFLDEERTVVCATNGRDGRPHLMPLWYVVRDGRLWSWTYAKSQKAKNLGRDPHATLQIEDGVEYQELRGVMFECDVEVESDVGAVTDYGMQIFERYAAGGEAGDLPPEVREMVEKQAPKRIGMRFRPTRTVSWDHRKLGGTY